MSRRPATSRCTHADGVGSASPAPAHRLGSSGRGLFGPPRRQLREQADRDLLCLAVELCSLHDPRPASLDAVAERAHDLIFASSTRRTIEGLKREYALREHYEPDGPRVRLVHLAYQTAGHELAAKTFDYSPSSIRDRWAAGQSDMASGLALLQGAADDERRFKHLAVDPDVAAGAAEAGARRVAGIRF